MNGVDTFVIWLNLAGCLTAVPVNLMAARHGLLTSAWLHHVIAVFAAIYALGYVMLLSGTLSVLEWSGFFRGVSVLVWPVVWVGPAALSLHTWRKIQTEVTDRAKALNADAHVAG